MAKWQLLNSTGISVGGEYYPADDRGVVDVPDNIGGLGEYGFTRFVLDDEASAAEKANVEALAAKAKAEAEAAEKAAAELKATEDAELKAAEEAKANPEAENKAAAEVSGDAKTEVDGSQSADQPAATNEVKVTSEPKNKKGNK